MTTNPEESYTKCPCCNNPWAAATGDIFAKLCADCSTSNGEETKEEKKKSSLRRYLDETVSPKDDFYHYANGTWIKENPIPPGYPSWNTFLQLHTTSQEQLRDLLINEKNEEGNDDDLNTRKVRYNPFLISCFVSYVVI